MATSTDVVVVGAGLAGLVAACEAADAGARVLVLDQEPPQSLGGQAHWSLGGLFLVDSPEQRRLRVRDSVDLAWSDWLGSAQFDRDVDHWPRRWARAYVEFAAGEKRAWLREMGLRLFPVVGWAERGDGRADGHGNSVPRFHLTWGTGPGVLEPFIARARAHEESGRLTFAFRHRVDEVLVEDGRAVGVRGTTLAPDAAPRGTASARTQTGEFEVRAGATIVTSGGIGGDLDLVRRFWPDRLGTPPERMVAGVPAHVDGRMLGITEAAGASLVNRDRMWHYTEGIHNWDPIWADHGIRILPGPSSLWLDATGRRLPAPCYPGFDTLGTLRHLRTTGRDWSWFILTAKVIEKEFALSGSEQNPDLTGRDVKLVAQRVKPGPPGPVQAFLDHGVDFVQAGSVEQLVAAMNDLTGEALLDAASVRDLVEARDREIANPFGKDAQLTALRGARHYLGDKLIRAASPHRFLDPKAGPLIAVRLSILTRKTLGGIETDLGGRVLRSLSLSKGLSTSSGNRPDPLPGLYAAGEVAGFGGGGMHGYNALEGTFLGGCLFSGREAGRAASRDIR